MKMHKEQGQQIKVVKLILKTMINSFIINKNLE
jgi:hypothetical protein